MSMRTGELSEDRVHRVVVGVALLLCGSAGLARADERLHLAWTAPADCPDREQVMREVDALLGDSPTTHPESVDVSVEVARAADDAWRVRIETPARGGRRELVGKSCRALVDAVDVILALMIEPELEPRKQPEPEPAIVVPPPEPPAALPPPSPPSSVAIAAGLVLEGDVGALPRAALGVGARGALLLGRTRVEASIVGFLPTRARVDGRSTAGADIRLEVGTLGVCHLWPLGPVELGPCLTLELGRMHGKGFGVDSPGDGAAFWAAARAGADLGVPFGQHVALHLRAEAVAPLVELGFVLDNVGPVHQPSSVGLRTQLAGEYRF